MDRYVGEQKREGQADPYDCFVYRNAVIPSAESGDDANFEKHNRNRVTPCHPLAVLLNFSI
jgi:hypothetical protein